MGPSQLGRRQSRALLSHADGIGTSAFAERWAFSDDTATINESFA